MNFAAVDLNLLRVFDAMMHERSTVRTGDRIGLSQPAVSSALGRLRQITGDELFVREGNRMVPTPKATELQEPVRGALRQLEEALNEAAGFQPECAQRSFIILGSDYFSTLLMPRLASQVTPEAPGVRLQMLAYPSGEVFSRIRDGRIDLAVERELDPPDWIRGQALYRSHVVCVAQRGHPVLARHRIAPGARIPAELFCEIPHVLTSMDGGIVGTIDPVLKERGLVRNVVMTVPHFHAAALAAAAGPLLGSLPVHFARHAADLLDLELYLPPFDPPIIAICVYWHRRLDRDPANRWLRGHVARALDLPADVPQPPPD